MDTRKRKILLVEDDTALASVYRSRLELEGFDVLDILRTTPETTNIRVIMLTALSQPKDKERAEQLGVDDYLVKSQVVIGDVVERVRYHLGMAA